MKNTFLLLFLLLFPIFSKAQGWEKTYDFGNDTPVEITKTNDGNLWALINQETAADFAQIILLHLDESGNIINTLVFTDENQLKGFAMIPTSDGGLMLGGGTVGASQANDAFLIKLNHLGEEEWRQFFSESSLGNPSIAIKDILETSTGEFLLSELENGASFQIRKVNNVGETIWLKKRELYVDVNDGSINGNHRFDKLENIIELNGNHFLLAGKVVEVHLTSNFQIAYLEHLGYLLHIDALGNEISDSYSPDVTSYQDIFAANDTCYWAKVSGANHSRALKKVNAAGEILNHFDLPHAQYDNQISPLNDGNFLISYNKGLSDRSFLLEKRDSLGELIWQNEHNYYQFNRSYSLFIDNEENSYIIGTRGINSTSKIIIIKTDALGRSNPNNIKGFACYDANANCACDEGENPISDYQFSITELPEHLIVTDTAGCFSIRLDTGIFNFQAISIDQDWISCPDPFSYNFTNVFDSIYVEFAIRDTCPDITTNLTFNTLCGAGEGEANISATGGIGNFSYQWSNGDTGQTAFQLNSQPVSVTVTSGNCSVVETFSLDFGTDFSKENEHNYGGSSNETPEEIFPLADGGFLLTGVSKSSDGDVQNHFGFGYIPDYWLVRIDADYNIVWSQNYGGSSYEIYGQTIRLNNGNFLVAGSTYSSDEDVSNPTLNYSAWIFEIDENGNLIREKSFGGNSDDYFYAVTETNNNELFLAGKTHSNSGDLSENEGLDDMWLLHIDAAWEVISSTTIGGSESDVLNDVIVDENGRVFATGSTESNDGDIAPTDNAEDNAAVWIGEFGSTGELLWQKVLNSSVPDIGHSLFNISDTLCVFAHAGGDIDFPNNGNTNRKVWLNKLTTEGTLLSQSLLFEEEGSDCHINQVRKDTEQNLWLSCGDNPALYYSKEYVLKVNSAGNQEKFISGLDKVVYDMSILSDSSFIAFGFVKEGEDSPEYEYSISEIKTTYPRLDTLDIDTTDCRGIIVDISLDDLPADIFTYTWEDGHPQNTRTVTIQEDTTYTIVSTAPNGCRGIVHYTIDADDFIINPIVVPSNCGVKNGRINLNISNEEEPLTINWSDGIAHGGYNLFLPGNYSVTVSDQNCTWTEDMEVELRTIPYQGDFDAYQLVYNLQEYHSSIEDFELFDEQYVILRSNPYQQEIFLFDQDLQLTHSQELSFINLDEIFATSSGFLLGGRAHFTNNIMIVETDEEGLNAQGHSFGGSEEDYFSDLVLMPEGGLVFCGYSSSSDGDFPENMGGRDGWIVRLDDNFDIMWSTRIGGSSNDYIKRVKLLPNGNILAAGYGYSTDGNVPENLGESDVWLIELNPDGEILNFNVLGGPSSEECNDLIILDNEAIIGGKSQSETGDFPQASPFVASIELSGAVNWTYFDSPTNHTITDIKATQNEELIFSSYGKIGALQLNGTLKWQQNKSNPDADFVSNSDFDIVMNTHSSNDLYDIFGNYLATEYSNAFNFIRFDGTPVTFEMPMDTLLCSGDTLILALPESPQGFDFQWSNDAVGDTLVITEPGLYVANLVSYGECSTTDSILIDLCEDFELSPILETGCNEVTVEAGFHGGTYLWSTGDTDDSTIITDSSWVSLQLTHPNGTIYTDSIFVNVVHDSIIIEVIQQDTVCQGASNGVAAIEVAANYDYSVLWSNGDTTTIAQNLPEGFHFVTVTNEYGCTSSDNIRIRQTATPFSSFLFLSPLNCHDGMSGYVGINATSSHPPYTYLWNTGNTSHNSNSLPHGFYSITATDAFGCTVSDSVTLVNPPEFLFIDTTIIHPDYNTSNGLINIELAGGTPPYHAILDGEDVGTIIGGLPAGDYDLHILDDNGCSLFLNVILGSTTAVNSYPDENISISPNPFSDYFMLEIENRDTIEELTIYNLLGQKISFEKKEINENRLQISTQDWNSGAYFVKIKIQGKSYVQKVIHL